MTPSEIDELERLMTAATPGKWRSTWCDTTEDDAVHGLDITIETDAPGRVGFRRGVVSVFEFNGQFAGCTEPDASAIAALHNAAPALIAAAREVERLRDRIAYLEAGLDAIRRHHSAVSGCLPTCAATVYVDADCDCGYVEADLPGDFAAAVLAGEADLSGALRARTATLR